MEQRHLQTCTANGCPLKPVSCDACLFHSRIDRRYWGGVTDFLNSPDGAEIIRVSRNNRMLNALGCYEPEIVYHYSDKANGIPPFKAQEVAILTLQRLKELNLIELDFDLSDRQRAIKYAQQNLEGITSIYENYLVQYVAQRAGYVEEVKTPEGDEGIKLLESAIENLKRTK